MFIPAFCSSGTNPSAVCLNVISVPPSTAEDSLTAYVIRTRESLGWQLLAGVALLWACQRVFARLQANFAQEL